MNKKPLLIKLLTLVKPFFIIMILAIILGVMGHLMAWGITVIAIAGIAHFIKIKTVILCIILFALLRGVCRYIEQACNHYIAFKVLAHIRHLMFEKLRSLAVAKLDGKERGNLIATLTSDTETLEVFFAHTISPVMIAFIYSIIVLCFIAHYSLQIMFLTGLAYLLMGIGIPMMIYHLSVNQGDEYRQNQGTFQIFILESILCKKDFIQFGKQTQRLNQMLEKQTQLEMNHKELIKKQTYQQQLTQSLIMIVMLVAVILGTVLVQQGYDYFDIVMGILALSCSFGPTVALANLANNLNQVIPCAKRIMTILEEQPLVDDITNQDNQLNLPIECQDVSFHYPNHSKMILENFNGRFELGKTYGIFGPSGCGKSTLLKLLMRIYEASGQITFNQVSIHQINSEVLKENISYVDQETFMFHDTLYHNITLFNQSYTLDDVILACKQACIHDYIMTLPQGYQTVFDDNLSSGQKQRIALARTFIRKSSIILLDEPTSHVDSLNEALILKSLAQIKKDKLLILVTHRPSTLSICDEVIEMKS